MFAKLGTKRAEREAIADAERKRQIREQIDILAAAKRALVEMFRPTH